ncbi:MAG: cryptochrome/photolyase family protein [Myxococcales bacterium]|nr:cryptochrome/photolyase family protein [Myxococcales bacterium]
MPKLKRGAPAFFVGPWDLNRVFSCVPDDPGDGTVVLIESEAKGAALPWHAKKLVLVLSAMRHFAAELEAAGYDVAVIRAPTYLDGIRAHVGARGSREVHALRPREHAIDRRFARAEEVGSLGVPLVLHDDGGDAHPFLLPRAEAAAWARAQKPHRAPQRWRQDRFYAFMRARTGWLMEGGKPVGGKLSFDADNRKVPKGKRPPRRLRFAPDTITERTMARVARDFPRTWGSVDGFDWPVTRDDARRALDHFVEAAAARFGPYQDAMLEDEPWMWHALLSVPMNLGLLTPREVVEAALEAHGRGAMPLASCEGFVRQVLGWREYMRLVYWERMPAMRDANELGAKRRLPAFYWEPDTTEMRCVRAAAGQVKETGYAHHIQRLMVLGNLGLLYGAAPLELSHWFWAGFVDAYEWVELPNVHGMALYADPTFTTKPYAASAAYLQRMSDHCGACVYDPKARIGDTACPFNALFWDFMARHRARLDTNPRVRALFSTWDRWDDEHREAIHARAEALRDAWEPTESRWSFRDDDG